ncbi:MAG: heme-binding protein [Hyphomicrobiaceae bacterium]|nr:heme-binding protein [Hyphomicrobiaceae bacterium]
MQEPVDRRALLGRLGIAVGAAATTAALFDGASARAQQPAPNPLDAIPEKAPFATPYGPPITLNLAQAAVQAALGEANKRSWPMNIAVVDSGGNLVAFARMDGAQLGSITIAEHKARAAVRFRRPTKAFEDAVQRNDSKYIMTLDDVIASRGGIPLVVDGKIIGAIGCSGGTGSQDEVVALAGAATVNKA